MIQDVGHDHLVKLQYISLPTFNCLVLLRKMIPQQTHWVNHLSHMNYALLTFFLNVITHLNWISPCIGLGICMNMKSKRGWSILSKRCRDIYLKCGGEYRIWVQQSFFQFAKFSISVQSVIIMCHSTHCGINIDTKKLLGGGIL